MLYSFGDVLRATMHRRYKRFLADISLASATSTRTVQGDDVHVAHCPNTGPMTGLLDGPCDALVTHSSDPKRKLSYSLHALRCSDSYPGSPPDGTWVGIHSARANDMVQAAVEAGLLDDAFGVGVKVELREVPLPTVQAVLGGEEVPDGGKKRPRGGRASGPTTRLDFLLRRPSGEAVAVEVKSVTLTDYHPASPHAGDRDAPNASLAGHYKRTALFPDTVSKRAQRHLEDLTALQGRWGEVQGDEGHRRGGADKAGTGSLPAGTAAALVLLVQRSDCTAFAPCNRADPAYAELFAAAVEAGVGMVAGAVHIGDEGSVTWKGLMPVFKSYSDACSRL